MPRCSPSDARAKAGRRRLQASTKGQKLSFTYVYILESQKHPGIYYTGYTKDLEARLKKHNQGNVSHVAEDKPWRIKTAVAFTSDKKAKAFELYLKSGSGRAFAKKHF